MQSINYIAEIIEIGYDVFAHCGLKPDPDDTIRIWQERYNSILTKDEYIKVLKAIKLEFYL